MEPAQTTQPVQPPALAPAKVNLPPVPEQWPGAFGAYKYSRDALRINIGLFFLFGAIFFAIGFIVNIVLNSVYGQGTATATLLNNLFSAITGTLSTVIFVRIYLSGVKRTKLQFGPTFKEGFSLFFPMLGVGILTGVLGFVSLLLLIIPFFFVFPRLILAPYILVDQKVSFTDAIRQSWEISKGNVGKLYGIIGATLAMGLLFFTIIGIPFALYFLIMYSAVYGVLYSYIVQHKAATPVQSNGQVSPVPSA